ncbi:DNA-binding response regulator, OmpR family, contains REC and winged-helix (wHTH) domain [Mariniphaga anaerophila]|uniref:DNA-binding response regulator, OmpR family, contains REC and winged-helix (WHTH) domain n=1 Tax=Mariniphaga anaerophila TaxID=1484053 RepID=A0A1M4XVZ1_9BACT|nr:response regulator transcription factor [Mariniphaga anaerophila]SHE97661.1 DNA-binding response regulator, OmpR family, contains REC and winged-helix (wHTH) domain [Mariniphaga anaerophila]
MKLLIIEDNLKLLEAITQTLQTEKYLCETATDFSAAHEKIFLYQYDILIVDINLPDGSGLDLIREAKKQNPSTGIIVISARNSLSNKIEGLELGADDYITKPFDMAELVARIKALLRRRNFSGTDIISFNNISINTASRQVFANGRHIELTKSEYDILLFFFSNPNRVLTRESIAEHIWGDNMDLADSFDFIYSHIKNLRKKLAAAVKNVPIKAVYGIGYKLDTTPPHETD